MRIFILLALIFSRVSIGDDVEFFKVQAKKEQETKSQYEYEDLLAGGSAFIIGNIGFFTSDSTSLRLAYSLVQTIGIINISDGVYLLNNPSKNEYYYRMLNKFPQGTDRTKSIRYFSRNLIAITAKNDHAKRISRFYMSSLLSAQYLINTLDGNTGSDLKKIYFFMAGINAITATYSYFSRSDYELYYEGQKTARFSPFVFAGGGGLAYSANF